MVRLQAAKAVCVAIGCKHATSSHWVMAGPPPQLAYAWVAILGLHSDHDSRRTVSTRMHRVKILWCTLLTRRAGRSGFGRTLPGAFRPVAVGTGLAPLRGLGSPLPHLHRDWPLIRLSALLRSRVLTPGLPADRPEHLPRRIPQLCNGTPHTHAMARRTPLAKVDRGLPMQAVVCVRPRASALCGLFPFPMDVLAARKYTRC